MKSAITKRIELQALAAMLGLGLAIGLVSVAEAGSCNLDQMQPGHWCESNNNTISDVLPSPLPAGGAPNIIRAWNSAVYDTTNNRLLVTGGGHGDYSGNEIYAFDINTQVWTRMWGPTPGLENAYSDECSTCADNYGGDAGSVHTYDGIAYIPGHDLLIRVAGSSCCNSGGGNDHTWTFDLSSQTWTQRENVPGYGGDTLGWSSVYYAGYVYLRDSGIQRYNPSTHTWSRVISAPDWDPPDEYQTGEIDQTNNYYIDIGRTGSSSAPRLAVWDLDAGTFLGDIASTTTGDDDLEPMNAPGLAWDSQDSQLVGWGNTSCLGCVYTLDTDSWNWTEHTPAAGNTVTPTSPTPRGTYGRWAYIPSKNVFMLVNDYDQSVYFYKFQSGSGSPAVCGNATVESGEQCDDGNTNSGDGCDANCQFEPACGDGTVDSGEQCDDGNTTPGDGCDTNCQLEASGECGNGVVETGEGCDDGDSSAGDGCDASCRVEPGWTCIGQPSSCVPTEHLHDFETGGPLTCSGSAPQIVCTDTDKMAGWRYDTVTRSPEGNFYRDDDSDFIIGVRAMKDFGMWLEVDDTKGAAASSGSLKAVHTGIGSQIFKKSDQLNHPDRIGQDAGRIWIDFRTNGDSRPELAGKDRLSFYWYFPADIQAEVSYGGVDESGTNVGTYACPPEDEPCRERPGCDPYSPGEPCDSSVSGHWYHHYAIGVWGGGGWVKLTIDQNPSFRRCSNDSHSDCGDYAGLNPTQDLGWGDYIPLLNRFYVDSNSAEPKSGFGGTPLPFESWLDEFMPESTAQDYAEPDQNENTIASVFVGYHSELGGFWSIGWDQQLRNYGTYEVKASLTEFTNANFAVNGTHIEPLANAATGGDGLVGKLHPGGEFRGYATKFDLPSQYEVPGTTVYFAIKDVSQDGQHGTAELEWATDERTSNDSRIYSVSYVVSGGPGGSQDPPSTPTDLNAR